MSPIKNGRQFSTSVRHISRAFSVSSSVTPLQGNQKNFRGKFREFSRTIVNRLDLCEHEELYNGLQVQEKHNELSNLFRRAYLEMLMISK